MVEIHERPDHSTRRHGARTPSRVQSGEIDAPRVESLAGCRGSEHADDCPVRTAAWQSSRHPGPSEHNLFTLTREVATATRHVGTFCGFEPASDVGAGGVIGRIYNATASGARQLHDYTPNTLGDDPAALRNFRANVALLVPRRPRIDVALYLSRETWALDPAAIDRSYAVARALRDVTDLDFITRRSVVDGRLSAYRTIVLAESPVLEPKAALALEVWVRGGGTLIATTRAGDVLGGRPHDRRHGRSLGAAGLARRPARRSVRHSDRVGRSVVRRQRAPDRKEAAPVKGTVGIKTGVGAHSCPCAA